MCEKCDKASIKFENIVSSAWNKYYRATRPAWSKYKKVERSAAFERDKVIQTEWAKLLKVRRCNHPDESVSA